MIRALLGDTVSVTLGWSEVNIEMGVADKTMNVLVTPVGAQLLNPDGTGFSAPITFGEAGIEVTDPFNDAERFFYVHGGYSYDPATETEMQGRIRCARFLAAAESRYRSGPYFTTIRPDSEPYDGDDGYDGPVWEVTVAQFGDGGSDESTIVGSLCGVACKTDSDPYIRVVVAELAAEHIPA